MPLNWSILLNTAFPVLCQEEMSCRKQRDKKENNDEHLKRRRKYSPNKKWLIKVFYQTRRKREEIGLRMMMGKVLRSVQMSVQGLSDHSENGCFYSSNFHLRSVINCRTGVSRINFFHSIIGIVYRSARLTESKKISSREIFIQVAESENIVLLKRSDRSHTVFDAGELTEASSER